MVGKVTRTTVNHADGTKEDEGAKFEGEIEVGQEGKDVQEGVESLGFKIDDFTGDDGKIDEEGKKKLDGLKEKAHATGNDDVLAKSEIQDTNKNIDGKEGVGGFDTTKIKEGEAIPDDVKKGLNDHGLKDEDMEKAGITKDGKLTKEGSEFFNTLSDKNHKGESTGFGNAVFDDPEKGILNSKGIKGDNPADKLKDAMRLAKEGEEEAKNDPSRAGRDKLYDTTAVGEGDQKNTWGTKKERKENATEGDVRKDMAKPE